MPVGSLGGARCPCGLPTGPEAPARWSGSAGPWTLHALQEAATCFSLLLSRGEQQQRRR